MLTYRKSSSMIKPEEVDDTSSQFVTYLHRNVEEKTDERGKTYYEYEEAKLTKMEYLQYQIDQTYINSEYAVALAELGTEV